MRLILTIAIGIVALTLADFVAPLVGEPPAGIVTHIILLSGGAIAFEVPRALWERHEEA